MDAVKENRVIMEALFVAKHSTCFVPTTDQFLDGIDAAFVKMAAIAKIKKLISISSSVISCRTLMLYKNKVQYTCNTVVFT